MQQTLLIAEGDAELCDIYRRFLMERGYDVKTASDDLDCLRKLRQLTPDVLLLDLKLPWGGGDSVLAWLRKENLTQEIPVILTATAGCPLDLAEFIAPPVVECLSKPFTLIALLERVHSAIATNAPREPSRRKRIFSELYIG